MESNQEEIIEKFKLDIIDRGFEDTLSNMSVRSIHELILSIDIKFCGDHDTTVDLMLMLYKSLLDDYKIKERADGKNTYKMLVDSFNNMIKITNEVIDENHKF